MSDVVLRTADVDRELGLVPGAEVLRWPLDAAARPALRAARRPCLWLLGCGELVPELDELEDWVRLPVEPPVLRARVEQLAARAEAVGRLQPGEVAVDADGLLVFGGGRIVVPRVEATILDRLGAAPDRVVRRDELIDLVWPDHRCTPRALDSRIHTLRARVGALGLHIHTIRGQGFLLSRRPVPTTEPARTRAAPRSTPWSS